MLALITLGTAAGSASAAVKLKPTLYPGARGAQVSVLQRDLTVAGVKTKVTGYYGSGTRSHVRRFQHAHRLAADGVAGPNTVRALLAVVRAHDTTVKGDSSGDSSTASGSSGSTGSGSSGAGDSGGSALGAPAQSARVVRLHLNSKGLVVIPNTVPTKVAKMLAAANRIAHRRYIYGGGHSGWGPQSGYDCSGSVSYVLHGAGLMSAAQNDRWKLPFDSTQFESYGARGAGRWVTLYANAGHVYMRISNLFFDTGAQSSGNGNDRWSTVRIGVARGFVVRHPKGW